MKKSATAPASSGGGPLPVAAVAGGRVLGVDVGALLPRARELAVELATDAGLDSALARAAPPA